MEEKWGEARKEGCMGSNRRKAKQGIKWKAKFI